MMKVIVESGGVACAARSAWNVVDQLDLNAFIFYFSRHALLCTVCMYTLLHIYRSVYILSSFSLCSLVCLLRTKARSYSAKCHS